MTPAGWVRAHAFGVYLAIGIGWLLFAGYEVLLLVVEGPERGESVFMLVLSLIVTACVIGTAFLQRNQRRKMQRQADLLADATSRSELGGD